MFTFTLFHSLAAALFLWLKKKKKRKKREKTFFTPILLHCFYDKERRGGKKLSFLCHTKYKWSVEISGGKNVTRTKSSFWWKCANQYKRHFELLIISIKFGIIYSKSFISNESFIEFCIKKKKLYWIYWQLYWIAVQKCLFIKRVIIMFFLIKKIKKEKSKREHVT